MSVRPKKHLGQHFLRDQRTVQRIADLLQAPESATVIEIGPGQGVLTEKLIPRYPHLHVIEVDPEAVAWLQAHVAVPEGQLIHHDVLAWNPESLGAAAYIGNLPYNISSPIFFHLLDHRHLVQEGVFMVQKEVANRLCAVPGNKEYGILSVLLGAFFDLKYAFTVAPGAFNPPPKVQSGVFRMTPRAEPAAVSYPHLKLVVKAAFNQRRKTLRNALKGLSFTDFPELSAWLDLRAEQLDIPSFITLTRHLQTGGPAKA